MAELNLYQVAQNMKKARLDRNLTYKELADMSGISEPTIRNWEKARTIPNMFNVLNVCESLDISIDEYMRGSAFVSKSKPKYI